MISFNTKHYWRPPHIFGHPRAGVGLWKRLLLRLGTHIHLMEYHCQNLSLLSTRSGYLQAYDKQNEPKLVIKSNIKRLKFDLVNIIDDRLIPLELKNRVDSGGTGAREEALSKKFFAICKTIESNEKAFVYRGRGYDFAELLAILGITEVEMLWGLLFNINGKEVTINADRSY